MQFTIDGTPAVCSQCDNVSFREVKVVLAAHNLTNRDIMTGRCNTCGSDYVMDFTDRVVFDEENFL